MPSLRPFRGLRYCSAAASHAVALFCPPYDVISPPERVALAASDPRNAVHLELPVAEPGSGDAYELAATRFAAWQADGTLCQDARALIYPYEQIYRRTTGEPVSARGFFCLLRLESFGPTAGVRPHELTMAGPKEDRYRLLSAVRANLSPVIMLYQSADGARSARLLESLMQGEPETDAMTEEGLGHRLWLADPQSTPAAAELLRLAAAGALTIADGHHRYETALRYRDEQAASAAGEEAAWVLVLLYEAASGGLSVLPTHRFVQGAPDGEQLLDAAEALFHVDRLADQREVLAGLARPGRLGLWTSSVGALLDPRRERVEPLLPSPASEALRWLDVTVLTSVLDRLVGGSGQELLDSGRLSYIKDTQELAARVRAREGAAFLLPATPVEAVLQIAAAGEQMPHKSTYFEPKAASGLVFNTLAP